jgi:hypothetical protein
MSFCIALYLTGTNLLLFVYAGGYSIIYQVMLPCSPHDVGKKIYETLFWTIENTRGHLVSRDSAVGI